jgi:NAD(P)-dependent dehydrogenase (short-subunit alcohol dehydrogenase family)
MTAARDLGVVVVTGANGGIGRAVIATLVERGWSVMASDLASEPRPELVGDSGRVHYRASDVTNADQVGEIVDAAAGLGRLVGCVANAGILAEDFSSTVDARPDAWRRTLEVNVIGVLLTLQATARALAGRGGRLTATASVAGIRAEPALPAYCASKAAVISIVRSLAIELGPEGITVNAVAPGPVATEAQMEVVGQRGQGAGHDLTVAQRFERRRAAGRPIQREATPEDVAEGFAWLLSDAAAYLTGQVLTIDGGATLI